MWFLIFWIISSMITCVMFIVVEQAITNSFKRQGINFKKNKISFMEQLKIFLQCCIPIWNIVFCLSLLANQEELEKEVLKKMNESGLVKKEDEW